MKKVRYIPAQHLTYVYPNLTIDNIYDVIGYSGDIINLLDDNDISDYFHIYSGGGILEFRDVSVEFRNGIIDGILK